MKFVGNTIRHGGGTMFDGVAVEADPTTAIDADTLFRLARLPRASPPPCTRISRIAAPFASWPIDVAEVTAAAERVMVILLRSDPWRPLPA